MSELEELFLGQLRIYQLPEPVREWKFYPRRRWRFDFAWPEMLIAVEVEGGTWVHGRHVNPLGFEKDCEKYNYASKSGWQVFRFTKEMIDRGEAINFMVDILLKSVV